MSEPADRVCTPRMVAKALAAGGAVLAVVAVGVALFVLVGMWALVAWLAPGA